MNILICGVGALGSNLVRSLVPDLKGEHTITILDKDTVEERNITAGTQWYFRNQIGIPKVEALQFNVWQAYEREIEIINGELGGNIQSDICWAHDLVVDCFDNRYARSIVQSICKNEGTACLHCGFSDSFTFAIEWAEHYKVPDDITSGMDICEMPGAAAFVNVVGSIGSLVVSEFVRTSKKLEIVGGKYTHSVIS